jgi:hypothetical protein
VRVRCTSPYGPSLGATGTLTRISAPQSGQGSQATVDIHVDLLDPKRSEDLHHPHMERPTTEIPATTHTAEITDTTETRPTLEPRPPTPPGPFVVAVGLLVALWCAGFAAISVWFEFTGYFGVGQYADDATAISVVNWFVAVLKVLGAAVPSWRSAVRPDSWHPGSSARCCGLPSPPSRCTSSAASPRR